MATSVPFQADKYGKWRTVVFTLFNYTDAHIKSLRDYSKECVYLIFGYEICPTTQRPHLQAFACYKNPRSIDKFIADYPGVHVEKQRGTHKQASDYCKKEGKYEEFGELPAQGTRTDWSNAVEQLNSGSSVVDVINEQPQLLPAQRALREYKMMTLKPLRREVKVYVLIGDAGTGKTRYAYDNHPDLYSKPRGEWWDGYTGQKSILLDDYYGYLPYCELLRVLDRYPYLVPYKGGFVNAQWDTVIITSNKSPEKWYSQGMTPALRRRLHEIMLVESIDGIPTLSPLPLTQEANAS